MGGSARDEPGASGGRSADGSSVFGTADDGLSDSPFAPGPDDGLSDHAPATSDDQATESAASGAKARGGALARWSRIGYLFLIGAVTTAVLGLLIVPISERFGPTSTSEGRVLDRSSETRTSQSCTGTGANRRCRDRESQVYEVVGARVDGSTWIVVGLGPYEWAGGKSGAITVETSSLTRRVVGLEGDGESWHTRQTGALWFGIGAAVIWLPLLVAYELARRRGRFKMGSTIDRRELRALVPGVAFGLFGLWFMFWSKSPDISAADLAAIEPANTFLAAPDEFLLLHRDLTGDGRQRPLNDRFGGEFGHDFAVVGHEHLEPDRAASVAANGDLLMIPMIRWDDAFPQRGQYSVTIERDGVTHRPTDCPAGVVEFPERIGLGDDNKGGFVCFRAGAGGGQLVVTTGYRIFSEGPWHPDYQLATGELVPGTP